MIEAKINIIATGRNPIVSFSCKDNALRAFEYAVQSTNRVFEIYDSDGKSVCFDWTMNLDGWVAAYNRWGGELLFRQIAILLNAKLGDVWLKAVA